MYDQFLRNWAVKNFPLKGSNLPIKFVQASSQSFTKDHMHELV